MPAEAPRDPLAERREVLAGLKLDFDAKQIPPGSMGLALSGGGIRSATIALGFVQSLARHKRLLDFDYLSTVSGGGYFGAFLRSLFVPDDHRGLAGTGTSLPTLDASQVQHFVEDVLSSDAKRERIPDPLSEGGFIRNPIWWLREHGRYLAPNGPTDYGFAISYLVRNWLAMLYTFTIAAAALALLVLAADLALLHLVPALGHVLRFGYGPSAPLGIDVLADGSLHLTPPAAPHAFLVSPIAVLPVACLFLALAAGLAYWLTVALTLGNPWNSGARRRPRPTTQFAAQAILLALLAAAALGAAAYENGGLRVGLALFWRLPWPWSPFAFGAELAAAALALAIPTALWTARGDAGDDFTNELRRRLTTLGATFNRWAAVTLALALIDTLALLLVGPGLVWLQAKRLSGLFAVLVPAAAWLIGKLPQWLGGGRIARLLGEHIWTLALVAGTMLFGAVGVFADAIVQSAAWPAGPWPDPASAPAYGALAMLGAAILILFVVTGSVTGFVNMSSLYAIYAGRLTRAFLGASNIARLRAAADPDGPPITENHPKDYIDVSCYQDVPSAAPIHLIGVTLNETRSHARSQLIDRDRKGVPVVFCPDGVLVDAARAETLRQKPFFAWHELREAGVESLGVGQLCAISGAAASAGMGARTTLGGALALSFANIRLGYWWRVGRLLPEAKLMARKRWWRAYVALTRPFRTYFYLWNEMTASYARENGRVYLSDGGHFENSGVYELLRRRTPVIVICDGGTDPGMIFDDLENLVRKARIDLGLAVVAAPADSVRRLFGEEGARRFLNGGEADWRTVARAPGGPACALLLDVYAADRRAPRDQNYLRAEHRGRIVWLKPRLFDDLPPDVTSYGLRNPPFPHQTTGDQFFDEAQWESYRALGYAMGEVLLTEGKHRIDAFRGLVGTVPPPKRPAVVATE